MSEQSEEDYWRAGLRDAIDLEDDAAACEARAALRNIRRGAQEHRAADAVARLRQEIDRGGSCSS